MSPSLMYWGKLIGGAILMLVGLVWALQGLNVLGGSGMSGHSLWLFVGAVVAAAGVWLIYGSLKGSTPG